MRFEFVLDLDVVIEVDDDDDSSWPSRWCFKLVIVAISGDDLFDTFLTFSEADEDEEEAVDGDEEGDDDDDAEAGVSEAPL